MLTSLAVSLALTLILEGLLALLWGVKDRWDWLLLLLVNVVTNPIVVSLHHLLGGGIALTVGLELFAVVSEWLAYRKWGRDTRPAFLFSLCANGFSYCSGSGGSYDGEDLGPSAGHSFHFPGGTALQHRPSMGRSAGASGHRTHSCAHSPGRTKIRREPYELL